MATTGFWPIKSNLKATVDYAQNPEKTVLPDGLFDTLHYAENEEKVRQSGESIAFVTGINCPAKSAYEHMMATKRHYGKPGGNLGYHGYQSFVAGEVTPQEAHDIGVATAKAMWGDDYEIVVATHLNTENIHNHIVVNSVSLTTGRKFENHVSDHIQLREISDRICKERQKSVLKNAPFYTRGKKKEYWLHQSGKLTHRDMVRRDVDYAISISTSWQVLEYNLKQMGYTFTRSLSIKAVGWERAVRIPSLGPEYHPEAIRQKLVDNQYGPLMPYYKPKVFPLLEHREKYHHAHSNDLVTIYFELAVVILQLAAEIIKSGAEAMGLPLSPVMRQEIRNVKEYVEDYRFLRSNGIATPNDLDRLIQEKGDAVARLEDERQRIRNRIRRPKDEEEKADNKEQAKQITKKIEPIRYELFMALRIKEKYPKLKKAMDIEFAMEAERLDKQQHKNHNRERGFER